MSLIRLAHSAEATMNRMRGRDGVTIGKDASVWRYRMVPAEGGYITVGDRCVLHSRLVCEKPGARIVIGDDTFISRSVITAATSISLGNHVMVSWGCVITDHDSHSLDWRIRRRDIGLWRQGEKDWSAVATQPVEIHDNAWIGVNSVILKGVTIGLGSVVAAGSVVTRDVAPFTLVAGNPARVLRELPE
jgi:acetyltransferase-like isoleucine patch superfamily enzyme